MSEYKRLTKPGIEGLEEICRICRIAGPIDKDDCQKCVQDQKHRKLWEYENIGSPEELRSLQQEVEKLRDRLQISPYGDDKIDELEEAIENYKFQLEAAKRSKE